VYLRIGRYELFLSEAKIMDHGNAREDKVASIVLKFSGDVRPNPSGLAGWERVIPLQALAELPHKDKGERSGSLAVAGVVGHDEPPGIEVTHEMIEAGVLKLYDYDPQFSNERDVVSGALKQGTRA